MLQTQVASYDNVIALFFVILHKLAARYCCTEVEYYSKCMLSFTLTLWRCLLTMSGLRLSMYSFTCHEKYYLK